VIEGTLDDTNPNIPAFSNQYGPNIPIGQADRVASLGYMQISPMQRTFVPYILFIDRNGMVQAQYTGADPFLANETDQEKNIRDEIEKLLAQPATPAQKGSQKKGARKKQ